MFDTGGFDLEGATAVLDGALPYVSGGPIEVDLRGADDRGHNAAMRTAARLVNEAEAARIEIVASAQQRCVHTADGHRDTAAWIRALLDVSPAESSLLIGRASLATSFPEYLDALRSGDLHLGHYDEILRAYRNERARPWLDGFVEQFVQLARTLPFVDFQHAVKVWISLADDDGVAPRDPRNERFFRVRTNSDGSSILAGRLDPAATAAFTEIFNRFVAQENRVDRDAAQAAGTPGEYPRSVDQRRADALLALAGQSVATPPGQPAKPLVRIVVNWHTAQLALSGLDGATTPVSLVDQLCRTLDGQFLPPRQVLEAMIHGQVQVLILDAMGNPFAMGKPGSLFTGLLRDGTLTTSAHCNVDGCLVPHRFLDADHLIPRSRGGPTSPDNGAAVCNTHNTWRHNHGYHLWRNPDGRWQLLRPDGTPIDGSQDR